MTQAGRLISVSDPHEFFRLTHCAEGEPYATELHRISSTEKLTRDDETRAGALAGYLAEIHAVK